MDRAANSECYAGDGTTGAIVRYVDGDLGVDDMVSISSWDDGPRLISTGLLFSGDIAATTTEDATLAEVHAALYMNHVRTAVALAAWTYVPLEIAVYYGSATDMRDPDVLGDQVLAEWGAVGDAPSIDTFAQEIIIKGDGSRGVPFAWNAVVRPPLTELVVTDEVRREAWMLAEWYLREIEAILGGSWAASARLEALVDDLGNAEKLFCVLLATEQTVAEELQAPHAADIEWLQENESIFYREVAAQEALLALEYLRIITTHLGSHEVDWLRGEVNTSQDAFDGATSTSEYVYLWLDGARDVLSRYRVALDLAHGL